MKNSLNPHIGAWYKSEQIGGPFEVVATDDKDGFVEVQYLFGEIDELELDLWYELDLHTVSPPDNWASPFEINKEDLGFSDDTFHPEDWSGPIHSVDFEESF